MATILPEIRIDPNSKYLRYMRASGRQSVNASTEVLRLSSTDSASDCSIIFISRLEASHVESGLSTLARFPALTVRDMPGFVERSGIIQFILQQNKVRFEVNLVAAHKCGLALSPQLQKLAIDVVGKLLEEAPR